MLSGFLETDNAVQAIDGREEVIRVFKGLGLVDAANEAYQIKIVFREQ